jgi:glycine oxidase
MQLFDTLIVGQGIAGSLMAYRLHQQNKSFKVLDAGHPNSASRVAAGMFTPVSGKRKTIDKDILDQIKKAVKIYREIEELLGKNFLHLEDVYQFFNNEEDKALLLSKAVLPEYEKILKDHPGALHGFEGENGAVVVRHSGWVDCQLLIDSFRQWLESNALLLDEQFNYSALQIENEFFHYKNLQFEKIIFCEGYRAADNPFFTAQNIIPCKGDIISIHKENIDTTSIIKRNNFYMLPAGNQVLKVGATYRWHNNDETLQAQDRKELELAAASILKDDNFTTLNHQTAIRATTPGREVIATAHPSIKNMFMLNGLGTKGILNGPWYSEKLMNLIFQN